MREGIYCCTQENNNCPKKDKCYRFINPNDNPYTTLFKELKELFEILCSNIDEKIEIIQINEEVEAFCNIKNEEESEVNKVSNES